MKGKLILLLALPVAAYLGVKVYLHLQVARTVDDLVMQMSPFAEVTYDSVTSSMDGKLGVVDIVIRPHEIADTVTIREISVQTPSMLFILGLENHIENAELPEALSAQVMGVSVSTRSPILESIEEAMYSGEPQARLTAFENCVSRTNDLPTQQYLLKYDHITVDLETGYYFDAERAQFVMHFRAAQDDAYDVSGEFALPLQDLSVFSLQAAFADPELARASLTFSDEGYFARLYEYCGEEDKIERTVVAQLLTEKYLSMFDEFSMVPNEDMVSDYQQFVDGGTQLVVSVDPREPKRLSYLSLYAPEDVPALLNITTQVN